jgi:hypothetical protein
MDFKNTGAFVISLDFELMWGVFDKRTIQSYGNNIKGVHKAIPQVLELLSKYNINATWATVGFIFNKDKSSLFENLPVIQPQYCNEKFSSYKYMKSTTIGNNETDDPYHFAFTLLEKIKSTPGQEICTHTYSHYYCLEKGQDSSSFDQDLKMACKLANQEKIKLSSIVFPRNQIEDNYLQICVSNGIKVYRGNELNYLQKPRSNYQLNLAIRLLRLLDSFLKLTGHNTFSLKKQSLLPINIPASAFLRPFNKTYPVFEKFKIRRIKNSMTYAAKTGTGYHLWWHPHNFGINTSENLKNLESILKHFAFLKKEYGFESYNMKDLGERLI